MENGESFSSPQRGEVGRGGKHYTMSGYVCIFRAPTPALPRWGREYKEHNK